MMFAKLDINNLSLSEYLKRSLNSDRTGSPLDLLPCRSATQTVD